jgi:NADPH:quinone reductase-like Zn-dependent oxidoreductase
VRAAVYERYGPPRVVHVADVEAPHPGTSDVLIAVDAAALNPIDWHAVRGKPYVMRLLGGLLKPKATRLGCDVAGQVKAVGASVTRFKPGDAVFGGGLRAFALAEYACVAESALVLKPQNLTFAEAAAVPVAALTALLALRDKGQAQRGQKVLINGAAGGVGTFAVQIAKWLGLEVTGICSTRNVGLLHSIGVDRVVDYTQLDFTVSTDRYDLIVDCVGNRSLSALKRVLSPRGSCVVITGPDGPLLGPLARFIGALVLSGFSSQKLIPFVTRPNQEDLSLLRELLADGTIRPIIDRCYPLSEIVQAIEYLEEGHARGKVVITVGTVPTA